MSSIPATRSLRRLPAIALAAGLVAAAAAVVLRPPAAAADPAPAASVKPLKALLVIGGCCHDYNRQKDLLKAGIEARAHVVVDVAYNPDTTTRAKFEAYLKDDWSQGYDVIIHDECSSEVKDVEYVDNILAAHKKGVPAVNLHCAMHSYRVGEFVKPVQAGSADALWFDFIGLQSNAHGPQVPIEVTFVDTEHPTTAGSKNWTTIKEELYNNVTMLTAHPLAKGKQVVRGKEVESVVVWTNAYGPNKTRVWSTSLGHNNETVADERYLDLVTRGLLWACDKLNDSWLKAGAPK
jgi:type 1 glutamine amidotransferase